MSATAPLPLTVDELKQTRWGRALHVESGMGFTLDAFAGPLVEALIRAGEDGLVVGDDWGDWQGKVRHAYLARRLTIQQDAFHRAGDDLRGPPRVRLILRTPLSILERYL